MLAAVLARPRGGADPRKGSVSLRVGIVVPVYNEAAILAEALAHLRRVAKDCPVVVVDGGSSDGTAGIARQFYSTEVVGRPDRGCQMNLGAVVLDSDVLLFLHADTRLPANFLAQIEEALRDPRTTAGCFRLKFDHPSPWLWFYTFWTRFRGRYLHFGDQAFFVRRDLFNSLGGYRELSFMEDVDFLARLRRRQRKSGERFRVIAEPVVTSARRFRRYGIVRQQLLNIFVVVLFELGVPPRWLARAYPPAR